MSYFLHRDGENNPQGRPRASEEEEKVVENGIPSTDEGGDFIFQTEVETDQEPSQLADRHFELTVLRQQGTTAKSTDWGEITSFKQTLGKTRIQLQQHKSSPVRRLRSASIGKGRHRLTRTSSMTPAGRVLICSFPPCSHAVWCVLCYAFFQFVLFCLPRNFPCHYTRY